MHCVRSFSLACLLLLVPPLQVAGQDKEPNMSEMAFGMVDANHDGKCTKREVKAFLGGMGAMFLGENLQKLSDKEKKELIDEVFVKLDTTGDKKIDKAEATAGAGFVQEIIDRINGAGGGSDDEEEGEDDASAKGEL